MGNGDHPFGALLVKDGEVVLTAVNTVNTDHDNTRHAELNLVSQAMRQFDADFLADCVLYTSTEPCAMCAGAIYWAGITASSMVARPRNLEHIAGEILSFLAAIFLPEVNGHYRHWPGSGRRVRPFTSNIGLSD